MNTWYIPMVDMKQTDRQRNKRDSRVENVYEFCHCLKCGAVHRKADFLSTKYRKTKEERYEKGVMPTYGLTKRDCMECK